MKIGVSSYSFMQHIRKTGASYTEICSMAKEMGFDGIEFVDLDFQGMNPGGDLEDVAREIRAHCEQIGLPIIAYTVGGDYIADGGEATVAKHKRCVDIAAILGAPLMRHDATWNRDGAGDWRAAIAQVAPYIREVTEYAQQKGIRTCTENHGIFLQDANRVEDLIRAVDHPNYGWLVDMGNFICADQLSIPAVTIAAPYAMHAHAKDFLVKPADAIDPGMGWFRSRHGSYLRGTIVGHGCIPIKACVQILKDAGYDGYLSYEFEGLEDNLTALTCGLAYLRQIVE